MLRSAVVLLAAAQLAFAAPPAAQATYCSEDNLLRAFQHTPTPASSYCVQATGYPTFLAASIYPSSRLSSACSCLSRFPTEPIEVKTTMTTTSTTTSSSPACTNYELKAPGHYHSKNIDIIVSIDLTKPCTFQDAPGYQVSNICGTLSSDVYSLYGVIISFDPTANSIQSCYLPDSPEPQSQYGLFFQGNSTPGQFRLVYSGSAPTSYALSEGAFNVDFYVQAAFVHVPCSKPCPNF